jgi:uncharacterized protein YuzE
MRDLRIEIADNGNGIYVAVDPDGLWARSSEVDERVTVDWDRQGRVIGIEVAGSAARAGVQALFEGLSRAELENPQAWADVLKGIGLNVAIQDALTRDRSSGSAGTSTTKTSSKRKSTSPEIKAKPRLKK